jgi:hypothetical protein
MIKCKLSRDLINEYGFITIIPFSGSKDLYFGISKKGRTYKDKYSITSLKFDEDFLNIRYESHEISLKSLKDIKLVLEYLTKKLNK